MKYSTLQVREKAIQAYSNEQTISSISEAFDVHRSTIHRWIGKSTNEKSVRLKNLWVNLVKICSYELKKLFTNGVIFGVLNLVTSMTPIGGHLNHQYISK